MYNTIYFFSSQEHPIRQNISNWSDVTNILEHLLENELHINDSEHPVMLTEMGQTSRRQREKLTEVLLIICIAFCLKLFLKFIHPLHHCFYFLTCIMLMYYVIRILSS